MEHKNILFDLDGTLTDPAIGITNSVMYALERFGISVEERSGLYKFIGPPLMYSFKQFYGFSDSDAKLALDYYRERFRDGGLFENEIYAGIEPMLKRLNEKGCRVILATSKPEEFAGEILRHFGILQYFTFVAGNTLDEARPEKRQVISHILANYPELEHEATVMVGDRSYDVLGAKEFGIPCIGVLYGYGSREELTQAGADAIAEDVDALRALLGA